MNHTLKKIIIAVFIFGILAFFIYSFVQYKNVERHAGGIVTCADDTCYWTDHIHAWVRINVCGEPQDLPKLTGPLSGVHTHTEDNIIHWHDKIPANPETGEPQTSEILVLERGLNALDVPFGTNRLLEKQTGDTCLDGTPGTIKFIVNGALVTDPVPYEWKDRDIIDIIFDGRTPDAALEYVRTLPTAFPLLTDG